jgi:hypothetical protein
MNRVSGFTAILLGGLWLAMVAPARADSVTFDLGSPIVTETSASFDVDLTFDGSAGDQIQAVQISVLGSDPALTANGADFSRFSFALDTSTLPGWKELVPVGVLGVGLEGPSDPVSGPFLGPSATPYHIGTLTIDLTGLPTSKALFATLAGGPPGLNTDVGGLVGGTFVPSFSAAGMVDFAQPNGVAFSTVPEPGSVTLFALGALALFLRRQGRVSTRAEAGCVSGE